MYSQQSVDRLLARPWRGRTDLVATRKATLKTTCTYSSHRSLNRSAIAGAMRQNSMLQGRRQPWQAQNRPGSGAEWVKVAAIDRGLPETARLTGIGVFPVHHAMHLNEAAGCVWPAAILHALQRKRQVPCLLQQSKLFSFMFWGQSNSDPAHSSRTSGAIW
jgi:hypothetical protein